MCVSMDKLCPWTSPFHTVIKLCLWRIKYIKLLDSSVNLLSLTRYIQVISFTMGMVLSKCMDCIMT